MKLLQVPEKSDDDGSHANKVSAFTHTNMKFFYVISRVQKNLFQATTNIHVSGGGTEIMSLYSVEYQAFTVTVISSTISIISSRKLTIIHKHGDENTGT